MSSVLSYYLTNYAGIPVGWILPLIFQRWGAATFQEGVRYYAEVHTSTWNAFVHSVFMPMTAYGILLVLGQVLPMFYNIMVWMKSRYPVIHGGVPRPTRDAYLEVTPDVSRSIHRFFYQAYMSHYVTVDPMVGALCALYYLPSLYMANLDCTVYPRSRKLLITKGCTVSTVALIIQEILGHWVGGDDPSRPEAVGNAILYAMYFSVSHFFNHA